MLGIPVHPYPHELCISHSGQGSGVPRGMFLLGCDLGECGLGFGVLWNGVFINGIWFWCCEYTVDLAALCLLSRGSIFAICGLTVNGNSLDFTLLTQCRMNTFKLCSMMGIKMVELVIGDGVLINLNTVPKLVNSHIGNINFLSL